MSEIGMETEKERRARIAVKKVLESIEAEFSPVMAHLDGAFLCYVDGLEVKFRFVSAEEMALPIGSRGSP